MAHSPLRAELLVGQVLFTHFVLPSNHQPVPTLSHCYASDPVRARVDSTVPGVGLHVTVAWRSACEARAVPSRCEPREMTPRNPSWSRVRVEG